MVVTQWCRSRISSSVYAINAIKNFVSHTTTNLILLYRVSLPTVWVLLWGSTHAKYISQIRVVQRKAVRIIGHSTDINGTKQLFLDLKLLTFDDIYKLALSRYMYCQVNMTLPVSLIRHYGLNADIHGFNTRQNSPLHKAHSRTVLMANSYQNVLTWMEQLTYKSLQLSLRDFLQYIHENILTLQLLID